MDRHDNHYTYLGIPVAASHNEVYAAVEDLIRQANALSYTSPDRARELWARIRRIKADLLTHPKRREAYDAELLRGLQTPLPALALALSDAAEVEAAEGETSIASWRPAWLVTALLSGALVAALVAALILSSVSPKTQQQHSALQPPAVAMSVQGSTQAGAYLPSRPIRLRWSGAAHATRVRIQLAAADGTLAAATAFRRPMLSVTTHANSYRLHLAGGRLYAWRLQTYAHGRWQPFGPPRFFYVARPPASRPLAGGMAPRHQRTVRRIQRHVRRSEQAALVRAHHKKHASSGHVAVVKSGTVAVVRGGKAQPVTVAYVPPRPAANSAGPATISARPGHRIHTTSTTRPARRTRPTGATPAAPGHAAAPPAGPGHSSPPPSAPGHSSPPPSTPGRPSGQPPASAGSSGKGPGKPPVRAPHPPPASPPPTSRPSPPTPPPASTPVPASGAPGGGSSSATAFGPQTSPPPAQKQGSGTGPKTPPPTSKPATPPPTSIPATPPPVSSPPGTGSPPPGDGDGQGSHPAHPAHPAHPEHPEHPPHPAHP